MIDYEPFCRYHCETKENPDGTDCIIHMQEGDVFRCRHTPADIGYDAKKGFYIIEQNPDPTGPSGRCVDFELGGLKEDIAEKLRNVPDDKKLETLIQVLSSKPKK